METPPIQKTVRIPKSAELLFEQFTAELPAWWPRARAQAGVSRMHTLTIDQREGGRILERRKDGSEREWGTVEVWDPPRRLRFSFKPDQEDAGSQVVEVTFQEDEGETEVTLIHSGWDALGPGAPAAREEFDTGWEPVLGRLASQE